MTKTETWQTRPLVREGAPKRQNSNFEGKKKSGQMSKIWAWHQDILTDCQSQCDFDFDFDFAGLGPKSDCSGNAQKQLYNKLQTRPLVREGAKNNKRADVWRKFQGERKIDQRSQMGAWHQDRLADWLSVVN
jgi:hypothetical protein